MSNGGNPNKDSGSNRQSNESEPTPLTRRDNGDTNHNYDSVVKNSMPPPPNPSRNGQSEDS